ncbi:MAG: hypothetical protein K2R98_11960 [Gemmataceae bacterium]|nr:hypothetical protein [Gemmataceae bacterium]
MTGASFSVACASCGQWHTVDRSGPVLVVKPFGEQETEPAEAAPPTDASGEERMVPPELLQLDMDWERERKRHLVFGVSGEVDVPEMITPIGVGVALTGVGAYLFYQSAGASLVSRLPGLAVIAGGIAFAIYRIGKARAYEEAYRRYQGRRRATTKPPDQ